MLHGIIVNKIYFIILGLSLIINSCSSSPYKNSKLDISKPSTYSAGDYLDHLKQLGSIYLKTIGKKRVRLSQRSNIYLQHITTIIRSNNELLFTSKQNIDFYIINNNTPFYFSLPGNQIFISTGVIQKHIHHEELLASIIVFELIKTEKNLYQKNMIIPVGFISTERIISLTRLSLSRKHRINKWSYYALGRAGFDPTQFLSWIQIQNKNTLDFLLHLGDIKGISREESILKMFIARPKNSKRYEKKSNSSADFYRFIKEIRRIKL